MSSLTDNATSSDPNASWLGFDSLKDVINTLGTTFVSYTAAAHPGAVMTAAQQASLPTNTDPVSGAQVSSANANTLQPNLGNAFAGILSNQVVLGGLVILAIAYAAHKVLK